ncbi:unnamed protein product [Vicia faba]|uniref:Response regulatory domain-containing protein n=1 Tax=Vicia faba TaxID=3906 RepID=A0AAV1A9X6_VICFA|nr:unnamed protein product [Vicia faba]
MPDMNSYHFLQHVTQQIRIPVIMMCVDQSTTPSLVMKAIEKGACGYWIKPLSEVAWNNVHGINYFNELQTDTSLAIEAKLMKRWEFDNIAQSVSYMSSWFSGTLSEQLLLKEHLDSASGEIFYDASRILLSGDLSERQALVEAEGISSDVSVCDKYLAKTAELLTSKCMTGCNRTGNKNTTTQSPFEFCNVLQKGKKRLGLKAFAETFKVIGNPLKPILNLRRNIAIHHHSPGNPSILFRKGFTHQSQRQFIPTSKFRVIRAVAIPLEPAPVEYAEYRKELAERYDFNQIGEPLPETLTLKDVITSLSKKVFEIDDVKAWKTVLISATSYTLGLLMISKAPWYLLPQAWAWTGTAVNGFFVIGHDCAHKSFLTNKLVEDIVGTLAFYH